MILRRYSFLLVFLTSCFFSPGNLSSARRFLKKGDCSKAYRAFILSSQEKKKKKKFIERALPLCEKKAPEVARLFYKKALSYSENQEDRLKIERGLVSLSFRTKDYNQALSSLEALFLKAKGEKEKLSLKHKMGTAYFGLKKYEQALVEINQALSYAKERKEKDPLLFFKGRVLLAKKDFEKALSFFKKEAGKNPALEGDFRSYSALLFEERGEIGRAIEELKKIRPQTSFSENKIRQLYERLKNQPGGRL